MRGAVFDWDGVIVDSSRHHEESWELLAAEEGHVLEDGFFLRSFGMRNEQIIPDMLGWETEPHGVRRVSRRKEQLYRNLVRDWGIEPLPGVVQWLEVLRAAGIPCVLASSTQRENIVLSLEALGLADFFRDIVSSEDVSLGKPDPEVFLVAAAKIGCESAQCVVFEDAHVGVEAALSAGMRVVAVTTTHAAESLTRATRVVESFHELTVDSVWTS